MTIYILNIFFAEKRIKGFVFFILNYNYIIFIILLYIVSSSNLLLKFIYLVFSSWFTTSSFLSSPIKNNKNI